MPTSSRAEGDESARIALDVHAHLAPINAARLATMTGVRWREADEVLVLDGKAVVMANLFHPERLLLWMNQRRVARALVSVPPPLYRQGLSEKDALEWAQYLNEEMLAICAASQGRLGALFYLPLEHPALAETLAASCDLNTYEGLALAAGGSPRIIYSDPCYEPLWARLDEKKAFVFVHPGACPDARLALFYLENLVGNPYETGVAATHLVMANVPKRYPGIRFCLAHAGGVFTSLCGRLQQGWLTRRPGVSLDIEMPLQAARRFYADGISHHPAALRLARELFGEDKILFGSDWPFPMGIDDPWKTDGGLVDPAVAPGADAGGADRLFAEKPAGRSAD